MSNVSGEEDGLPGDPQPRKMTEEELWAAAAVREGEQVPRLPNPHVGIENIKVSSWGLGEMGLGWGWVEV